MVGQKVDGCRELWMMYSRIFELMDAWLTIYGVTDAIMTYRQKAVQRKKKHTIYYLTQITVCGTSLGTPLKETY